MQTETNRRGVGDSYDPFDPAYVADPYGFFGRARTEQPIFYSPALNFWVVTRHDDALAILKDHRRFAIAIEGRVDHFTPEVRAILGSSPIDGKSLVEVDGNDHTRLRSAITKALSAQRVATLEPRLRVLSADLIDGFADLGRVDIVDRYARLYPIMVIGTLTGIPEADFRLIQHLSEDRIALIWGNAPPDEQAPFARSTLALAQYVFDMAERRRQAPGDDLISELIQTVEAGEVPMTTGEVAAMLRLLIVAGFETTIKLLGNCLVQLLTERRQWQALVDDPQRIPAVVEEALRMNGPLLGTLRMAREPVEIGGTTIPAGAMVQVHIASASRDEAAFDDPAVFDPDRERSAPHLAFGYGIHFCVGAALARLEMRIALEQLTKRLPSLRLTPGQTLDYGRNILIRGPRELLVEWDA